MLPMVGRIRSRCASKKQQAEMEGVSPGCCYSCNFNGLLDTPEAAVYHLCGPSSRIPISASRSYSDDVLAVESRLFCRSEDGK
jgi:hypothetical protein